MKKFIYLFIFSYISTDIISQEMFNLKSEATNIDKRKFVGSATFTTSTTIVNARIQNDGRNLFSLEGGKILSKTIDDNIKLSLMPGLVYDWHNKQLYYSGSFFWRAEEIKKAESYFYVKGMKNFNKEARSRWLAEGEVVFGGKFKLGPMMSINIDKHKTDYLGREIIKYNDLLFLGVRFLWKPPKIDNFHFTTLLGYQYENLVGRVNYYPYAFDFGIRQNFIWSTGIGFRF